MVTKRLPMRRLREILRQKWVLGCSHRAVAESVGVSAGAVAKAMARAQAAGVDWSAVETATDEELEARLYGPGVAPTRAQSVPQLATLERARCSQPLTFHDGVDDPTADLNSGAVLDLNGDGDLDFVGCREARTSTPTGLLIAAINDGAGHFMERDDLVSFERRGNAPKCRSFAVGDIDDDGDLDVVACGSFLAVLRNDHGALREVTTEVGLAEPTDWCRGIALVDYDADGDLDLTYAPGVARLGDNRAVGIMVRDNQGGVFSDAISREEVAADASAPATPARRSQAAASPCDGRTWMRTENSTSSCPCPARDVAPCPGRTSAASWTAHLRSWRVRWRPASPFGVVAADLDRDGHLEIVVNSEGRGRRALYRNRAAERATLLDEELRFLFVAPRERDRPARGFRVDVDLDGPPRAPDFEPGLGRLLHRTLGVSGANAAGPPEVYFGLGGTTGPVWMRVFFADGTTKVAEVAEGTSEVVVSAE